MSDVPPLHIRAPELRSVLEKKASRAGMSLSKFVRQLLESSLRKQIDPSEQAELKEIVASLRRDLARVGSNLNQIAFQLNAGESASKNLKTHLQVTLEDVRREFAKTMKSVKACEKFFG